MKSGSLGRPRLQRRARVQRHGRTAVIDMSARDARLARDGADGARAFLPQPHAAARTARCSPAAAAPVGRQSTSRTRCCPPRSGTRTRRPGRPSPRCTNGRLYHSTALLLPDGRVLMAGGGALPGSIAVDQKNAEIYSPPYLFKGARPTITAAPATMQYGATFDVTTPNAAQIAQGLADPLAVGDARVRQEPAVPVPQLHRRRRQGDRAGAGERESRAARRLHALPRRHERRAVGGEVRPRRRPRPTRPPPTVAMTAPAPGATVSGTVSRHLRPPATTTRSAACSSSSTARTSAPRTRLAPYSAPLGHPDGDQRLSLADGGRT